MDIFFITYCLSQACLGEINDNFRRIYWALENENTIKLYFYLLEINEEDKENICHEIVPMFEYYLDGNEEEYSKFNIEYEIFYDRNEYLKIFSERVFIEFYRTKSINI